LSSWISSYVVFVLRVPETTRGTCRAETGAIAAAAAPLPAEAGICPRECPPSPSFIPATIKSRIDDG
jgi:hypothetical protein